MIDTINTFEPQRRQESGLESVTGHSDQEVAGLLMFQLSHGIGNHVKDKVPSAAVFEQGLSVLDCRLEGFAGSGSRQEWVKRMIEQEDRITGDMRKCLLDIFGVKAEHPLLHQSIAWCEKNIGRLRVGAMMLLSELYMKVGDMEKAKSTYSEALSMQQRMNPDVPLIE